MTSLAFWRRLIQADSPTTETAVGSVLMNHLWKAVTQSVRAFLVAVTFLTLSCGGAAQVASVSTVPSTTAAPGVSSAVSPSGAPSRLEGTVQSATAAKLILLDGSVVDLAATTRTV